MDFEQSTESSYLLLMLGNVVLMAISGSDNDCQHGQRHSAREIALIVSVQRHGS
jgi:hypothetical protein